MTRNKMNETPSPDKLTIPVIILAGGQATRLGGQIKCLINITDDDVILDRLLDVIGEATTKYALNYNGNQTPFSKYKDLEIIPDLASDQGPLGGIAAGFQWLRSNKHKASALLSIAGDTPFINNDMLALLLDNHSKAPTDILIAHDGKRPHPTIALWPTIYSKSLDAFLNAGERKIMKFVEQHPFQFIEFKDDELFFNINSPEDIKQAKDIATRK